MSWGGKCTGPCNKNSDVAAGPAGRFQYPEASASRANEKDFRTEQLIKEVAEIRAELKCEFEKFRMDIMDFNDMISYARNRVRDFESKIRYFENKLKRLDEIEEEAEAELEELEETRARKEEERRSSIRSRRGSKATKKDEKKDDGKGSSADLSRKGSKADAAN